MDLLKKSQLQDLHGHGYSDSDLSVSKGSATCTPPSIQIGLPKPAVAMESFSDILSKDGNTDGDSEDILPQHSSEGNLDNLHSSENQPTVPSPESQLNPVQAMSKGKKKALPQDMS